MDHSVDVIGGNGSVITVTEWQPFSLDLFSFIELEDFIQDVKDATWEKWNSEKDILLFEELRADIEQNLSDFIDLNNDVAEYTDTQKEKLYNSALSQYQKLNTLNPSDALFVKKLELKNLLLSVAGDKDKELLAESLAHDVADASSEQNYDVVSDILTQFDSIFADTWVDVSSYVDVSKLPEDIQFTLSSLSGFSDVFQNASAEDLLNKWKDFLEQSDTLIQDSLNTLIGK